MSVSRLLTPLLCTVSLVVAGCGASESPSPTSPTTSAETPQADSPAGVYGFESTVTQSTIPVNKPGPKSLVKADLFLTCETDAVDVKAPCAAVFQRVVATGPQGGSVRLEASDNGYSGSHAHTGSCPKGGGGFRESFAWDWSRLDGGALEGTIQQVFEGCDLDGKTTYEVTAAPKPKGRLPYLADADAAAVAAALTTYDAAVASVYDEYPRCQAIGDRTPRSNRCFVALYRGWEPDVRTLATSLEGPTGSAQGVCRTVTRNLELSALGDAIAAAGDGFTVKKGNKAVSKAGDQHGLLTSVGLFCVPPEDYATLGEDGKLAIDVNGVVPPSGD